MPQTPWWEDNETIDRIIIDVHDAYGIKPPANPPYKQATRASVQTVARRMERAVRAAVAEAHKETLQWVLDHKRAPGEERIRITVDFEGEIAAILSQKEPTT